MGITKTDHYSTEQLELAAMAKALAHPARIAILEHVLRSKGCVNGELVKEIGLAQATVSQHLRELKNANILQGNVEGTRISYCVNPEAWQQIRTHFQTFFNQLPPTSACC